MESVWNVPRKAESRLRYITMVGKPLLKCQFRLLTYRWILGKTAAICLDLVSSIKSDSGVLWLRNRVYSEMNVCFTRFILQHPQ
jgi:hypothetical protein